MDIEDSRERIRAQEAEIDRQAAALIERHPRLIDLIAAGAEANPDGTALVYLRVPDDPDPPTIGYGRFMGLLAAAIRWYRAQGLTQDDTVSVLAPGVPATQVALWAAVEACRAQPLNLLFTREAIAAQLNAVGARLLLVPPPGLPGGLYEKVAGLEREVPTLERIVTLPVDGSVAFGDDVLEPDPDWRSTLAEGRDPAQAERVAALYPTGGTTGRPKVAKLTNRSMVAASVASMLSTGTRAEDRLLLGLPLFHVGGAFTGSIPTFTAGAALYIATAAGYRDPKMVQAVWRLVDRHRLTVLGVVPTVLGALCAVPRDGLDISSLRLVGVGAATLPPEVERRFNGIWGGAVRQVYGMTELSGAVAQWPHYRTPDSTAVGPRAALAELAVLADGVLHRDRPGPLGELLVRGPSVFAGYVDPRDTAGAFHRDAAGNEWLRTGDLARIDAAGCVHIAGRLKDVIIRGGHNIDPRMLEDPAAGFPGVALAAAVGRPDAYAGEVPMLFVTSAGPLDAEALARFLQERVDEPPAKPREVVVLPEMPLTPVGKIFKPKLRQIAAERACRDELALALPGVAAAVEAVTEPERGMVVVVRIPGGAEAEETARRALGRLPLAVRVEPG